MVSGLKIFEYLIFKHLREVHIFTIFICLFIYFVFSLYYFTGYMGPID